MAKLRMAHASTHGARKPPGPKYCNYYGLLIERKYRFIKDNIKQIDCCPGTIEILGVVWPPKPARCLAQAMLTYAQRVNQLCKLLNLLPLVHLLPPLHEQLGKKGWPPLIP